MLQERKKEPKVEVRPVKRNLPALDTIPVGDDALLTPFQIATILQSSIDLVRAEIRMKRLRASRIGKRGWRILRSDINEYIKQRSNVTPLDYRSLEGRHLRGRRAKRLPK